MANGEQVRNGKAFEYALAFAYNSYLTEQGVNLELVEDSAFNNARDCYNQCSFVDRKRFDYCASLTIDNIFKKSLRLTDDSQDTVLVDKIHYGSKDYPCRWFDYEEDDRKYSFLVSSSELNEAFFSVSGDYDSQSAQSLDEMVFCFAPRNIVLNATDEELSDYIKMNIL